MSGYVDCACPTCFEIAIADGDEPALCWACAEADCDGETECQCDPDEANETVSE